MQSLFKSLTALVRAVFRRPLFIVLVTVVAIALMVVTRPKLKPVDLEERVWPVEVVTVKSSDHQPDLKLFGEVVAGRRSEMRALVPGTIVEVGPGFREGAQSVPATCWCRLIRSITRTILLSRRRCSKRPRRNLKIKRRDLKRIRDLFAENNVSEQSLDDAMLAVEQQESMLEQRRIGLERARRALSDARLTAPYDGVVSGVSVDLGKRLSVSDKVADIIDTERLEVRFSLSNAQFGRIIDKRADVAGRVVEVNWEVGERTLTYQATVQRVGAEIDSTTGGVVLYATIEPEAKALLRPGRVCLDPDARQDLHGCLSGAGQRAVWRGSRLRGSGSTHGGTQGRSAGLCRR